MRSPEQAKERYDLTRKISRGKKIRTAAVGILGFAGTIFIANGAISSFDNEEIALRDNAEENLQQFKNTHEESVKNLVRTKQSIGESCMSSLAAYMPGGALANSDENTVVSDMMGETNLPCGDTPKEIRQNVKPLRSAYEAEMQATQQITETEASIVPLQEAIDQTNAGEYILAGIALVIVTGFGTGLGSMWADSYEYEQTKKHGL